MSWIDRLELKLGRYAIPNLIHYIAGFNALAFILYKINPYFFQLLNLDPELVMQGQVWRLFTYIFIPNLSGFWAIPDYFRLLIYVLYLLFIGNGLEQAWGSFNLNLFYFIGMLGTTIAAFCFGTSFSNVMLNTSLFFAFARFYPDVLIYLFYILPVKIKWLAWIAAAWLMLQFLALSNDYRAALIASLANYFLFFGKEIYSDARLRNRVAGRRAEFKRQSIPDSEALHSCSVCGKTDLSHVELEFRVGKDGRDYCIEHLPKAPRTE